jgi:hypothetical protein
VKYALVFLALAMSGVIAWDRFGVLPDRTEAEFRARARRQRKERLEEIERTGKPAALIADYPNESTGPVPAWLNVSPFYRKFVDAQGIPVLASENVPDTALLVARDVVNAMLAARPDLRKALVIRGWRTAVIGELETTMDIPEYSRMKRPGVLPFLPPTQADRDYHANRSRGLGGLPTTGAEENLLGYPRTPYWGENIFVHEFAHAIMGSMLEVDHSVHGELGAAFRDAMAAGKYRSDDGRRHYATTDMNEYWAEGVQWWFFSNYGECFTGHVKVETPDEFAAYDPTLNALIGRVFTTHQIPMDAFYGRRTRPVHCS